MEGNLLKKMKNKKVKLKRKRNLKQFQIDMGKGPLPNNKSSKKNHQIQEDNLLKSRVMKNLQMKKKFLLLQDTEELKKLSNQNWLKNQILLVLEETNNLLGMKFR